MSVEAAVLDEIALLAKRDSGIDETPEAAVALELARQLDSGSNSATSKSMCARSLNETLERLRALAPPAEEGDKVDELAARAASPA